jgi:Kdo2-lipid IVA lauroyltransferase/acyltransferase
MQYLRYLFAYPIIWIISMLPFRLLYLFSDFVYIIVYRIIGYRKKLVRQNLALTLPHLSNKERLIIEKKFYHHMCDMFLEMVKTMNISKEEISKRFVFTNLDLYKDIERQGKSIAMMGAHYASYEWAPTINFYSDFQVFPIYKQIKNPYFDDLVHHIRSVFKATLITTKKTIPTIIQNNQNKIKGLYLFGSDQTPKINTTQHWTKFMGIDAPVHIGAEMLAKRYDMNVLFLKIKKVKRGYYEGTFEILSENAKEVPNHQITDRFIKLVEEQIYEAPEYYLWTHNRWKHRKEDSI